MGFINLGCGKSDKETRAQAHLFLYRIYHLPRFINPILQMERVINSIYWLEAEVIWASMQENLSLGYSVDIFFIFWSFRNIGGGGGGGGRAQSAAWAGAGGQGGCCALAWFS